MRRTAVHVLQGQGGDRRAEQAAGEEECESQPWRSPSLPSTFALSRPPAQLPHATRGDILQRRAHYGRSSSYPSPSPAAGGASHESSPTVSVPELLAGKGGEDAESKPQSTSQDRSLPPLRGTKSAEELVEPTSLSLSAYRMALKASAEQHLKALNKHEEAEISEGVKDKTSPPSRPNSEATTSPESSASVLTRSSGSSFAYLLRRPKVDKRLLTDEKRLLSGNLPFRPKSPSPEPRSTLISSPEPVVVEDTLVSTVDFASSQASDASSAPLSMPSTQASRRSETGNVGSPRPRHATTGALHWKAVHSGSSKADQRAAQAVLTPGWNFGTSSPYFHSALLSKRLMEYTPDLGPLSPDSEAPNSGSPKGTPLSPMDDNVRTTSISATLAEPSTPHPSSWKLWKPRLRLQRM
ncbi:hypothetical protein K470DRAFT_3347 [Piedraia hortae CBS 480.64]|uniref:Uncharacterized protein n=1 Tax=Piedraia hortae CBS 480.64 TaxID=1314780 RepID=A0A6A7CAI0_9PEZI|nr:hypothetical protein K470DRAFT_3347 [Piedraia hortae CBS 480.64]